MFVTITKIILIILLITPNLSYAQENNEYKENVELENAIKTKNLNQLKKLITPQNINTEFAVEPSNYESFILKLTFLKKLYIYTPILYAIEKNFLEGVKFLLSLDADLNKVRYAVSKTTYRERPLSRGKSIFFPEYSALALAINRGNLDIIKLLISANADVNIKTNDGMTPLHIVCSYIHKIPHSLKVIELLIEAGADVNATNSAGYTPLDYVSNSLFGESKKVSEYLKENGATRGRKLFEIL